MLQYPNVFVFFEFLQSALTIFIEHLIKLNIFLMVSFQNHIKSTYILNIHLSCCKVIYICLQVVTPRSHCSTLTTGNQIVRRNNGGVVAQDIMNHHMRRHSHPAALTAGGWGLQAGPWACPLIDLLWNLQHVVPADTLPAFRIVFCQPLW